ncbi:MAG: crossover junction endodeoxyribonuclease RuvC [Candidatus Omnitrophota bacterium]|nr:MAG: crossover junction endodeoxyribonuclease RuvC [Candidatus Omnitrophota bacterium]
MRVLGIDPGTITTGFGIVENKKGELQVCEYGLIKTKKKSAPGERLNYIHQEVSKIIGRSKLDIMVIEDIFLHKNFRSAVRIGEARCSAILAALKQGLKIIEYLPTEIKQAVVGNGRASKIQVQSMVKRLLHLPVSPPADAADALAAAICHCYRQKYA